MSLHLYIKISLCLLRNQLFTLLSRKWSFKNVTIFFLQNAWLQATLPKKKTLFKVVLIILRQRCTGQNPIQCCPGGSRQQCIGKSLCNIVLILLGQHCIKNYTMLSQRLQTWKNLGNGIWKTFCNSLLYNILNLLYNIL